MLKARTLTVQIDRSIEEVYDFLVEPANLMRWAPVGAGRPEPLKGLRAWSFESQRGAVLVHFTARNPYHVLDYTVQFAPHLSQTSSVRLIRNGASCVLTHTSMQHPAVSDAAFASEEEWLNSDLLVLKTLLER